ncbi:MAG TPA: hypothetical protein VHG71_05535 [Verrucomicrobiae bacterium]|nr:hypothetical protein [Verrucomicrobiae bacterium]
MRKIIASLAICALANIAAADTQAYEPFNYGLGAFASGTPVTGSGFTGSWTVPTGNATIVAGLSYSNLLTADNALQQANNGSGRSLATFSSALSSGTEYVSFLIKGSGDSGGNWAGVYLQGDNATSLFVGFRGGYSASQTSFGLGSVNSASTSPTGGSTLGSTVALDNTNVHLIVLKIDFNTSGVNDTVSFWADPPAGTNAPGVAANVVYSTYDVGNISGIGLNLQGGSASVTLDEICVGSSYADVVGANLAPTIPTTLALSVASSKQISWTANSSDYYQPQKSDDGVNWTDLGDLIYGSTTTSIYDSTPSAYYQVLETAPVISEQVVDGGFEVGDGFGGAFYWVTYGSQQPTLITSDSHSGADCMFISVTNVDTTPNTSGIQQDLSYVSSGPIIGGNTYNFSFWAKQVSAGVSYVQQYNVMWLDVNGAVVGSLGWNNFSGGNGAWTQIVANPAVAPATAVDALIQIQGATGAILNGSGGVLIDDVSLTTTTPTGATDILSPTVQNGAVFTGVVQTNGVTATAASGTITFQTNGVVQSAGTVGNGTANSSPATVPSTYTITAIYSGDGTYIGSTNTLVVGGGGDNFGSGKGSVSLAAGQATVVMSGISGNQYQMQRATNVTFTAGVTNFPVVTAPGDGNVSVTDDFSDLGTPPGQAFYRLIYIP